MGRIGLVEILVILLVVSLFFGIKRLPEIGESLGKAIKGFKKAIQDGEDEGNSNMKDKKE